MTQYAKASAFGGGGFNSPMTTQGDLITQDATDPIRLAIGGAATVLTSDGTDPSWDAPVGPALTVSRAVQTNAGTGLIEASTVTNTELAHVSGVTSAIQTQFSGKEPTITGAATTIASSNLTVSRAVVSDGSGKVVVSTTTAAELLHVNGVTSAIQTQLGTKQATITGGATTIASSDLTISRAVVSDGSGKVAVSTTTAAELLHVNGVTSAIQTQFSGKEPTITGAATTIASADLTVSRALVSDGSGKVAISTTTSAELLHVNGVTSAIQTQLNTKSPALYDAVVDAAGGGDYTSISAACLAEAIGATIYIRNGEYAETVSCLPKENQKIIGESQGGVTLTTTAVNAFQLTANNFLKRTGTQRATTNDAWDAVGGLGTLSVTLGSAVVPYTGSGLPVAGDVLLIKKDEYYIIDSVSAPNITLTEVYQGGTATGVDGFVSSSSPLDFDDWTVIKNISIINSTAITGVGVFLANSYGAWLENISWDGINTGINTGQGMLVMQTTNVRTRAHNLKGRNRSIAGACMIFLNGSIIDLRLTNCEMVNVKFNALGASAVSPFKYNYLHWSSISGCQSLFFLTLAFAVNSEFIVDNLDGPGGWTQDPGGGNEPFDRCRFRFGLVSEGGRIVIIGKDCMVDLGNTISTSALHEVGSKTASGTNVITAGNIEGTLTVDGTVVIGGGVAYKVLSGVPAQDNGYNKP